MRRVGEGPRVRRAFLVMAACVLAACGLGACTHRAKPRAPARPVATVPVVHAQLTPDVVIAKARGATGIQRCYTRYLKHRSGHGRVLVSFTVDAQGRAQDGAAAGVPAKLGDCIVAEVERWHFPPPRAPQSFAVPLDLQVN